MRVVGLGESLEVGLVGGKGASLGALVREGERVPDGFVVTTEAFAEGVVPRELIAERWRGMGAVAVRSSATGEDSPGVSFAGQHDTVLGAGDVDAIVAAVEKCWASVRSERAVAYRERHGLGEPLMAVVVQRMVTAARAGVLFTADPVSGRRDGMLVEAAAGPGSGVVDGSAEVQRYSPEAGTALRELGERMRALFGTPQDVEWAEDADGTLWVLQSRPITTLFPAPPAHEGPLPRVYVEFGHVQGMLRPVTPMGMSSLQRMIAAMMASLGVRAEIVDIGGRLYGDLSDLARHPSARKRLVKLMAVDFGPRAQAVMEHVLADPRFAPVPGSPAIKVERSLSVWRAVSGILRSLARPADARRRVLDAAERLRIAAEPPPGLRTTAERMAFVRAEDGGDSADDLTWPIVAGLLAGAVPGELLKGIATPAELQTVLGGVPDNVTIEMDLALWRIAREVPPEHRETLLGTPPQALAALHLAGKLPEIGLEEFIRRYGHRGPAEADLGVPRWSEDPAGIFAAIANYLLVTDPDQAPDVRFARAAARGEAALDELARRVRWRRPLRGRLAIWLLRRARVLSGLREYGKFAGLHRLSAVREQLLLIGEDLLENPADIMFLTLDEVESGGDHRRLIAERRATYEAECRRRHVPVALLSDGTDVETLLAAGNDGVGASPGRVTGRARIVHDPATARIEPGEILVVATTDPAWTPLFLTAGGLVSETGAVMAHGPTVAREYGLPAVISVRDATTRFSDGQLITVDGAAGTVTAA
ncbi:phosphoenolpyruvate synthase [Actinoplanes sp. OR16]|uniref:PEP/pyruvate-binding domain-containing protein n=1 Tax=Actinoplanes sp. OR16 TaxID=946334 RepID=UPI000F70859C|nr:PEP/pyruvate-binding domain-containing protein [Actinoplanes sp. OR16]BBH69165.1 phosphoenolpyruvate synthase [Actinoplanes sp. OR16]